MEITDYLTRDRVLLLQASTKAEALDDLAAALAGPEIGVGREELTRAILQREEMMSTGIGQGLAIPHVRMEGLKAPAMAIGVSRDGISDYESLDNQPVHIMVLIAAPQGQHDTYIRLLAKAANVFKRSDLRERIIKADDPAEIYAVFAEKNA